MTPPNTATFLARAEAKFAALTSSAEKRAAAEQARTDEEARVQAKIDAAAAAKRAEADAFNQERDAVAAEVARLKDQAEAERIAEVRRVAESADEVTSLWSRVDSDTERLESNPYGDTNMQIRSEFALRRSTTLVCPAELWRCDGPNLAAVDFAGMTFRVARYVSDVVARIGYMDIVSVNTPTGYVPVFNLADLTRIGRENPSYRNTGEVN